MNQNNVFKKCLVTGCRRLIESKLLDPSITLCTKHNVDKIIHVKAILEKRFIPIDYFRICDKDGKDICIICGKPLKHPSKTFCEKHDFSDYEKLVAKYDCSKIRFRLQMKRGNICEVCGSTEEVDMHHIIPVISLDTTDWRLCFEEKNMILLCKKHHLKTRILKSDNNVGL